MNESAGYVLYRCRFTPVAPLFDLLYQWAREWEAETGGR